MERQLLERMVGGAILIAVLVIVGPAILDGDRSADPRDDAPAPVSDELRSHTVRLNARPPLAQLPETPSGAVRPGMASSQSVPRTAPVASATNLAAPARAPPPEAGAMASSSSKEQAPRAVAGPTGFPVTSVPPAAKPSRQQVSGGSGWFVQIGTFGQRANADRLVDNLSALGFTAVVSTTERSGKPMHRVRVGPAADRAEVDTLAAQLAAAGHRGQIVPP
jgi:DedD protein